jgi:hypothetical protein
LEPTRSVLHRSAASIALRLGDVATATRYTEAGLRGNPPPEIRDELNVLREKILVFAAGTSDYRLKAPSGLTPFQQTIRKFTSTAPVDIVALANALGLAVREVELGNEVSGEIFADAYQGGTSGYSIHINASDPVVRKRFTVAHELAHFLRHRSRISNRLVDDRMYRSRLGRTVEAEANRLAAQLLIPGPLLSAFLSAGINSPEELATKFTVSVQAMKIRMGITN